MQTSGVFGALSDQVIKQIVDFTKMGLDELDRTHVKLFKQETTTRKFVRKQGIAPFQDVPLKPEGGIYSFDVIQPGYSKDITPKECGLGFLWTETSMEDDDFEVLGQYSKWLGFSMRVYQETAGGAVFNNAFSTQLTADGIALCATNHPLKRGGTCKNKLSVASDMSIAAFAQLRSDMRTNTKLDSGQLVRPSKDVYLVCHPDQEWLAHRLVKSSGLPQTADNDTNPANDLMNITVLPWEYLSDTDAWFFVAKNSSTHGLVKLSRIKPKLNPVRVDPETGNNLVTIRAREHWDSFDWRNVAGSEGA